MKHCVVWLISTVCSVCFSSPVSLVESNQVPVGLIIQTVPVICELSVTKVGFPEGELTRKAQDLWVDSEIDPGTYVVRVSARGKTMWHAVDMASKGMVHLSFNFLTEEVDICAEWVPDPFEEELVSVVDVVPDEEAVSTNEVAEVEEPVEPDVEPHDQFLLDYAQYQELVVSNELNGVDKMAAWTEVCQTWELDPGPAPGRLEWNEAAGSPDVFAPPLLRVRVTPGGCSAVLVQGEEALTLPVGRASILEDAQSYRVVVSKSGYETQSTSFDATWSGLKEIQVDLEETENIYADLGLGVYMEMVLVQPGWFVMGSDEGDADEKPSRQVTVFESFWIASTEVTQQQYESVMQSRPSQFPGPTRPVERVSWRSAMEFCRRLTAQEHEAGRLPEGYAYCLPTEAQWEYACRAGTTGDFAGNLEAMAWYSANAKGASQEVATKAPNAWGLYDMHGNVWELCLDDWYRSYYGAPSDESRRGDGSHAYRVGRGGGWGDRSISCRASNRYDYSRSVVAYDLGFRPVISKQN